MNRLVSILAMVAALALAACNVNEYCIDCPNGDDDGDGGVRDGGIDANDGGTPPDACVPTGGEACNGLDDDCDGTTDEDPEGVGAVCSNNNPPCVEGVTECIDGEVECSGISGSPEACDNIDNNCNGVIDDGNPEGGDPCGSDLGECVAGITTCTAGGVLDCVGDMGTPGAVAEVCDGRDNDCDNSFDEGIATMGPCGTNGNVGAGECELGVLTCVGGAPVCLEETGPQFELCDGLDQDCDGATNVVNPNTNGYDLQSDVRNCNSCGNSCINTIPNSTEICMGGVCRIGTCDPGFYNSILPANPGPDCLYGCDFQGPVEDCNADDDDCDGITDENTNPPAICATLGACAGTTAECTPSGFDCEYTGDVSLDGNGNLQQETECDGVDNDCDGRIDEGDPQVFNNLPCSDTALGECRDFGHYECNPANQNGAPICVFDDFGLPPPGVAETCNGLDDNCDGTVDNGIATGGLQAWVQIGGAATGTGSKQIMQYEASRPDAPFQDLSAPPDGTNDSSEDGLLSIYPCSKAGVKPWVGVTQPEAETACAAIGARLCSEQEWHQACSAVTPTVYPVVQAATGVARIFIEAEDYFALVSNTSGGVLRTWVPDYTAGFSGVSAMRASPNTGASISTTNAPTQSPRLDFRVDFRQIGTHRVFVRMYSPDNDPDGDGLSNDDQIHVGISTAPGSTAPTATETTASNNAWLWEETVNINVGAVGVRTVSIYMQEDGVKVDAIAIDFTNAGSTPTTVNPNGGDWAFATNPDTYVGGTCNGEDLDADLAPANAGDQDDVLPTGPRGTRTSCFANGIGGNDAYDMSGNVKEWTAERTPNANPIRGGSTNNEASGISCGLAFTLATDTFFFDNVGFRCCRTVP